jgi:hypothetical protein
MKTTVVAIAAIVGSLLAGCVAGPSAEDMAAVQTGKEQCNRLRTSVAQTRCLVAMGNRYIRPTINKNQLDLYDLGVAEKLALAEKVDAGQMTQAEADLQMAQTLSHIASEGQQRDTNSTIAWAAWKSQMPRVQSCQAAGSSYSAMVTCY